MSKIAVVYWSGTGNTEAMANAVLEGAKEKGAEAVLLTPENFDVSMMDSYDAIRFWMPGNGKLRYWKKMNLNRCLLPVNQNFQEKELHCLVLMDGAMESG